MSTFGFIDTSCFLRRSFVLLVPAFETWILGSYLGRLAILRLAIISYLSVHA